MEHDPSESAFHDPPPLDDVEASDLGVPRDDFGVDADFGGVFDELGLEAGVHPGLGDRRVQGFDLVQHLDAGLVLGDGGRDDDHREEQAERVGDDASLSPDYLFGCINSLIAAKTGIPKTSLHRYLADIEAESADVDAPVLLSEEPALTSAIASGTATTAPVGLPYPDPAAAECFWCDDDGFALDDEDGAGIRCLHDDPTDAVPAVPVAAVQDSEAHINFSAITLMTRRLTRDPDRRSTESWH